VIAYINIPQTESISTCGQQLDNEAPSKATLRIASFSAVRGRNWIIGCKNAGSAVLEKNVPDKKYCGNMNRLAYIGMTFWFFAMPVIKKPKPINTSNARKLKKIISMKVKNPLASVK
jgi:hypothetical protein